MEHQSEGQDAATENGDTNLQAQQVVVMLPAAQIKARLVDTCHSALRVQVYYFSRNPLPEIEYRFCLIATKFILHKSLCLLRIICSS